MVYGRIKGTFAYTYIYTEKFKKVDKLYQTLIAGMIGGA
jgi:hypothetical protein